MDTINSYIGRETYSGSRVDIYLTQNNKILVRLLGIYNNPYIDDESASKNMYIEITPFHKLELFEVINIIYDNIGKQICEKYNENGPYIHINKTREFSKNEHLGNSKLIPFSKENLHIIEKYAPNDIIEEDSVIFYGKILENGSYIMNN